MTNAQEKHISNFNLIIVSNVNILSLTRVLLKAF